MSFSTNILWISEAFLNCYLLTIFKATYFPSSFIAKNTSEKRPWPIFSYI